MNILIVEPFHTGSHKAWAEGYQKHSRHQIELLTLPGRHWKWRMAGGAVALAQEFNKKKLQPDLILATDMLDFSTFLGLIDVSQPHLELASGAIYFHENQITYPWSPTDSDKPLKRDHHYGFINYTSALAANAVFFNSEFHRRSFLEALPKFLKMFPDYNGMENVDLIAEKSEVLHLGMEFPPPPPEGGTGLEVADVKVPTLVWNHRWEYDKNPEEFFELIFRLETKGVDYQLIVLGESYKNSPPIFAKAKEKLAHRILHWGFAESKEAYFEWLRKGDILPVTSRQDFFGGSVVEAMACGCIPLLPKRLAYPEHLPAEWHEQLFYESKNSLYEKLKSMLLNINEIKEKVAPEKFVAMYDWSNLAPRYDAAMEHLIQKHK